jgi:hypothetical protein
VTKAQTAPESNEKITLGVGDRVEKFCKTCGEERGHVIASLTKLGKISRVKCPKCGTSSSFKSSTTTGQQRQQIAGAPYDRTRSYRTGQTLIHPIFGPGEVTAVIEPQKIDVLFSDRIRRLVHANRS